MNHWILLDFATFCNILQHFAFPKGRVAPILTCQLGQPEAQVYRYSTLLGFDRAESGDDALENWSRSKPYHGLFSFQISQLS
jgi:hypothetical protein